MFARTLPWAKRSTPTAVPARKATPAPRFRPGLDTLEDRLTPAALPLVNLPLDVGPVQVVTNTVNNQPVQQLQAPITLAGQQAGTLVMDATTSPGTDCTVLNLHLNEISLNLLGLHVDTSKICLDITGDHDGGLLGDLVCGLAGDLTNVAGIIDSLNGPNNDLVADVNTFLGQLEGLLDDFIDSSMTVTNVLGTAVGSSSVTTPQTHQGSCDVLNLSLGPINLNLLGLHVSVDDCANGPVTVDVTADPQGGLLGGLLCGLADGNLNGLPINRLVGRLDNLIDRLGVLADRLDEIADLPDRFERVADRLVNQVQRIANKADSLADLDRLVTRINRTVRRLDRLIDNTDAPASVTNRLESLLAQLTGIVNRFRDLGLLGIAATPLDRAIDVILARL